MKLNDSDSMHVTATLSLSPLSLLSTMIILDLYQKYGGSQNAFCLKVASHRLHLDDFPGSEI